MAGYTTDQRMQIRTIMYVVAYTSYLEKHSFK